MIARSAKTIVAILLLTSYARAGETAFRAGGAGDSMSAQTISAESLAPDIHFESLSTFRPVAAATSPQSLAAEPAMTDPEEVLGASWDGGVSEITFADVQSPIYSAPITSDEMNSLRAELRAAVGRLNVAQQQLDAARQQQSQIPADNDVDGPRRISRLETAFDSFRRQMSREGAGAYPSARLTGFTQLDDYALYQDPRNKATVGAGQNGVGFRRAARGDRW